MRLAKIKILARRVMYATLGSKGLILINIAYVCIFELMSHVTVITIFLYNSTDYMQIYANCYVRWLANI